MTRRHFSFCPSVPPRSLPDRRLADLLPVPNGEDISWFQNWYQSQKGVDLPYEVARPLLTHLVQFFYLTRGHELYDHNQRVENRVEYRASRRCVPKQPTT